jgi:hypothetical protein
LPFTLVGLSVWLPFRESDSGPALIAIKLAIWFGALAWLLARTERRSVAV